MEIKPFGIEYYDAMIELWKISGIPYKIKGRDSKEEIERQMNADRELFIGAFEGKRLVGVVIASHDRRKGWINRLAVLPEFRGRGIGKNLISSAESVLRKRGMKVICTLIEDDNEISLRLFQECGYTLHRDIFYLSKREGDEF